MGLLRLSITSLLTISAGGFHFGFLMSVINPLAPILQEYLIGNLRRDFGITLSPTWINFLWSATVGVLFIGAGVGALMAKPIIDCKGPKKTLLISAMVLFISSCSTAFSGYSTCYAAPIFVFARLLSGIGIGMGTTTQGVFLSEISPVDWRGVICSLSGFSTNIGFVLAGVLALPPILGTTHDWHIIFIIQSIPSLTFVISAYWLLDSPVYLLRQGRGEEAVDAVKAYGGRDRDVDRLRLQGVGDEFDSSLKERTSTWTITRFFKDSAALKALKLTLILNIIVPFSGILAVSFFGTFLLNSIGFSRFSASVANALSPLAGTAGAVFAIIFIDKLGRRLLVIGSLLLLAAVNSVLMILMIVWETTKEDLLGWAFLILLFIFYFCFSAGIGPTAWFLGAELAPTNFRARIQALGVLAQTWTCFLPPIVYYPLLKSVGPLAFIIYICPLTLAALYFYRNLPETMGRTYEEIQQLLRKQK